MSSPQYCRRIALLLLVGQMCFLPIDARQLLRGQVPPANAGLAAPASPTPESAYLAAKLTFRLRKEPQPMPGQPTSGTDTWFVATLRCGGPKLLAPNGDVLDDANWTTIVQQMMDDLPAQLLPDRRRLAQLMAYSEVGKRGTFSHVCWRLIPVVVSPDRAIDQPVTCWPQPLPRVRYEFQFLASSADEAEKLAEAFLLLYNRGYAWPRRQAANRRKAHFEQELANSAHGETVTANFERQLNRVRKLQESLSKADILEPKRREQLEDQKTQFKIDLAGVEGRLAAIGKLHSSEPADVVVGEKRRLQLEAAETSAKVDFIEDMTAGSRRQSRIVKELSDAEGELAAAQAEAASIELDIRATAPVETLGQDLPVAPVEWDETLLRRSGGMGGGMF